MSVGITKDGAPTGFSTPKTFTGLTGTHTFTVPSTDANGHPFEWWSTGSTSTTITVDSGGTYTAYYMKCATVASVWTTDASGNPEVEFNPSEPVYLHWQGNGCVNITVRYHDGTVDQQWLNLCTSGVKSFVPSHGSGPYNITCTACTKQTMIAYGTFLFAVPEYLLGTLMALATPLLATVSYLALTKRKKKT